MNRLMFFLCVVVLATSADTHAQSDGPAFTDDLGVRYTVERYITANYPVALTFDTDGRMFYTEKTTGSVRVVDPDGEVQDAPVITLPTSSVAERGMFGIAIDPDYAETGHIWVAHIAEATARDFAAHNIVRFTFDAETGTGSDPQVMFSVPLTNNALIHHGGNLRFDDAGHLFFSMGDNEVPANAQDLTTPQGAIHRFAVTDDGLVPAETNPFADSSIFAYGLRNPFDFDIDPFTEDITRVFATENGDACDDEINVILRGFHYGAGADYECGATAQDADPVFYQPPLLSYTPTQAPTGIVVYDHEAVPAWEGVLFFCTWNTGTLRRITLNEDRNQMVAVHEMALGDVYCRIDVEVGPEGGLYFTTVGEAGGEVYRVLPVTNP